MVGSHLADLLFSETDWQKEKYEFPLCVPSSTKILGLTRSANQYMKGACPNQENGKDTFFGKKEIAFL